MRWHASDPAAVPPTTMTTLRRLALLALLLASPAATSAFGLVLPPRSVGRLSRRPTPIHTVIQAGGVDDEAPSDAGSVEEEAAALEEVR